MEIESILQKSIEIREENRRKRKEFEKEQQRVNDELDDIYRKAISPLKEIFKMVDTMDLKIHGEKPRVHYFSRSQKNESVTISYRFPRSHYTTENSHVKINILIGIHENAPNDYQMSSNDPKVTNGVYEIHRVNDLIQDIMFFLSELSE